MANMVRRLCLSIKSPSRPKIPNTVQAWCPTNGGPYRFVLNCMPASKSTTNFTSSARVRIASSVSRWLHPSFTTQGRWYGMEFAVSQPFQP